MYQERSRPIPPPPKGRENPRPIYFDDFYLQGVLAKMKCRSWWADNGDDPKNRYDYIAALAAHAFSWTFVVMLPIAVTSYTLSGLFYVMFIVNVIIHAIVDNAKANEKRISLVVDQLVHVCQVVGTFVVFQIWP